MVLETANNSNEHVRANAPLAIGAFKLTGAQLGGGCLRPQLSWGPLSLEACLHAAH